MTVAGGLIHGKAPPDRVLIIASMSRQSDKISSAANQGSRERDMVAIVAALARELLLVALGLDQHIQNLALGGA